MRVVELDAVEARRLCVRCRVGEEPGEDLWELGDVGEVGVRDALAVAHLEVFALALAQDLEERHVV